MSGQASNLPTGQSNEGFDLSQIFIGRQQQLDLFEIYLMRWKRLILDFIPNETIVTTASSPNNKIQGLVVLLFGRGGFGKSTLLKHYRAMVLQEGRNIVTSKIVDWEFAVEGKRSLFNPPQGQQLDAAEYFKVLCGQLAIALNRDPKEFKAYQATVKDVEKAKKEASNVLDSMQKDDRYGWLRGLTVEIITSAVSTYAPGSKVVVENKQVQDAVSAVTKLTQEQIAQIYARLHNKLGNKLGDYLEPSLRLGLALGSDLRDMARNYPLLIFFDTYEEADEGDRLLRIVMGAAGIRVGWMLAGRDNLWAGSEQRERSVDVEYGYKEIVPTDRGLSINFNAGDIGTFTLSDITQYFALLREKIVYQPPLPEMTEEQAKRILDVTQGVPLAIKIAAGLYVETANVDIVTENVEGKRAIVDQMVHRYLLHTRTNMEERAQLYSLALLRRADQPTAIAAALGLTPEQARTSYSSELSRLHRRYSFIFTEKEQPALHQEVRYFLRLWLQEHRKEPEIVAINQRLKETHESALKHLEEQIQYHRLKERLQDDEWVVIYLDLTEQQFWLDPIEGVRYALPFMIAAAIYRRDINEDAINIGQFFEQQIRQPYRDWWTWATQSLVYTTSRYPSPEELTGLEELTKLASERCPTFPQWLPDYRKELEAALWWRLGESYQGRDENKALEWHEQALSRLNRETELREASAELYYEYSSRLYDGKKYRESLPILKRAIELKPDYAWAYILRGIAYNNLKEYQRAIQDYDRAIELDPNDATAYNNRGSAYDNLKEYQRAIQDYDRAIELDPNDAKAYYNRGNAYDDLKEYQRAIQDYDRAIELDPNDATAYNNRGSAYDDLKEYQRAIQDYDRAIELDPNDATAYNNRGSAYDDLKEYQRAIQDYDRAIELDPNDATAYNNRGNAYRNLKEYQRAIQDYDRAIELDPNDATAYNNRGSAYYDLKEYQRAIQDYDRAIELDPNDATAYNNRGSAYRNLKEYQRAIQDYDRAIELDPNDATAYNNRGSAYYNLKEYQRAIQDYDRAIELDPNDATAYYNRGLTYYYLKEYQRAIQDYDRAIELDPNDAATYFNRGLTNLWLKNTLQAKDNYSHSYEIDSTDVNAAWMSEWAGMSKQRPGIEMAVRLEVIAAIDSQLYVAYVCRGVAAGLHGKVKEGLEEVEKAISLESEEWDAFFWKGMLLAYYYRGQPSAEETVRMIERSLAMNLPPILLTPLYWLEEDRHDLFEKYIRPLLLQYDI